MGAQRWLDLGVIRFQPSEIMKIAVPLCCAWYLHERPLPPDFTTLVVVGADRPGAGAADRRAAGPRHRAAGRRRRRAGDPAGRAAVALHPRARRACSRAAVPVVWMFLLHDYQRQRVLTFLEPAERPARRRLPHHPVADRDRLGRAVRQGLHERQPGAARVPAGALDRLHLRGDRRGVRPGRLHGADGAVPAGDRRAACTSRCRRRTPSRA